MKAIDPKYSIEIVNRAEPPLVELEAVIVKTATGEPIPDDEPLILFRARDRHAADMLRHYEWLCMKDECTDFHMAGIDNRARAFEDFARDHPERMKQPGITKGL